MKNNYCENCNKFGGEDDLFCDNCGSSLESKKNKPLTNFNDTTNTRMVKVFYILLHLPMLIIVPAAWITNEPYCYYDYACNKDYSESFWYSLLTLLFYVIFIRLIKITYLYIVYGYYPRWEKELRKIY